MARRRFPYFNGEVSEEGGTLFLSGEFVREN